MEYPFVLFRTIVLSFTNTDKTMVLNKTNGYSIADLLQIDDPSNWVGSKITIFPKRTSFGNKMVDCIRVRDAKAPERAQEPARKQYDETDENSVPF